jgi:hypothetical protein
MSKLTKTLITLLISAALISPAHAGEKKDPAAPKESTEKVSCHVASGLLKQPEVGTVFNFGDLKLRLAQPARCAITNHQMESDAVFMDIKGPGVNESGMQLFWKSPSTKVFKVCGKEVRVFLQSMSCLHYPWIEVEVQDPF